MKLRMKTIPLMVFTKTSVISVEADQWQLATTR